MRELAEIIKELREKKGTQTAVAGRLKVVTSQQLGSYERGDYKPKADFFEAWKREYGEDILAIQKGNIQRNVSNGVENSTYVKTLMENPKNEKVHEEVYRDLVESNSEYRLVPKVILDRYEILSQRELESRERVLSAMLDQAKEISATKQLLLDEKDKLIVALEEEIYELRAKLNQIPPAEGAK